ncbi:hypothetical protein [Cloacibacillus sp.]|uniref:phage baseplate protein n=1 Tax=Cloacibacillus sp. TaxID=2049023 RepID=UPI0025BE8404|nr:hypothetical protein [Cloacibacillus sp.]MCC8056445.1 hypothetical protein [Cloacibacillus sp.]
MANIIESSVWEEGVREVGQNEPVTGGRTGTVNLSLQDIANRTVWLRDQLKALGDDLAALEVATDEKIDTTLKKANDLSDVHDVPTARKNLGIATLAETLQTIYPVGAIYISVAATSPATLFGFGKWEQIQGRFIVGAGQSYAPGATGGEDKHILTVNEMPEHGHSATSTQNDGHTHSGSASTTGRHQHGTYGEAGTGPWGNYMGSPGNRHGIDGGDNDNNWYNTSPDGDHSHIITIGKSGAHAHTITVKNTGGGEAHNNMPPYFAAYIWRRTA